MQRAVLAPHPLAGGGDGFPVLREGTDLTIVSWGAMVHEALAAAVALAAEDLFAEVIDLATLKPYDLDTVLASVKKTGRCMVASEAPRTCGLASEISANVAEQGLLSLLAPVERVTGFDTPYPHSLEWAYFPGPIRIGEAIDKILKD